MKRKASELLVPGIKMDLLEIVRNPDLLDRKRKSYPSAIFDMMTAYELEIAMPAEKGKMILLQIDEEYEVCFYIGSNIYRSRIRITDRYKNENNVYLLKVDLLDDLEKFQRRGFFRLKSDCEIAIRPLTAEETKAVEQKRPVELEASELNIVHMVDISGGGLAFTTENPLEIESYIFIVMDLVRDEAVINHLELLGQVRTAFPHKNDETLVDQGVEFVGITQEVREQIVKYVFEEERLRRRKQNYN